MAAAGITRPTTVADVRKAYLFYPKLSGTPEHVFHIDDRQIPGRRAMSQSAFTLLINERLAYPSFFSWRGVRGGNLGAYDNPLRSVTNRCECIVVSVAYRLSPENKYPAAPEDAYAATKWVAEHATISAGIHVELLWEETAQAVTWRRSHANGPRARYAQSGLSNTDLSDA